MLTRRPPTQRRGSVDRPIASVRSPAGRAFQKMVKQRANKVARWKSGALD